MATDRGASAREMGVSYTPMLGGFWVPMPDLSGTRLQLSEPEAFSVLRAEGVGGDHDVHA